MNTINIPFEDEEFTRLKEIKGQLSWHDFIIYAANRIALQDEAAKKMKGMKKL